MTVIATAATAFYWMVAHPKKGRLAYIDHNVYLATTQRMHDGAGFYRAFFDASATNGITVGQPRGFRMPTIFMLWRLVPVGWLYGLFLCVVVIGTVAICCHLVRYAVAAIPVGLYLLFVGRRPIEGMTLDGWLLVEFWALPAVAGCLLAARWRRPWAAALLAALAASIREVAVLLLIAGLVDALVIRRRTRDAVPWITGFGLFLVAFALHLWVANGYVHSPGNEAALLGTGSGLRSAFGAIHFRIPQLVGVALYILAFVRIWRTHQLFPAVGLFLIPVLTAFVARDYWGLLLVPFTILFAADLVIEVLASRFYDWRSHGATPAGRHDP